MEDPADMRRDYRRGRLDESSIASTWFEQLRRWFDEAVASERVVEPNAVQLATVGAGGRPAVRTVLIKEMSADGLVFYSNYESAKARDLAESPYAAAVFAWLPLERQARVAGPVEQISRAETDAYFAQRPRGSQLGAWASPQSAVVSRADLDLAAQVAGRRFADGPIPAPPNWGGYRLRPDEVEFWQGRPDRLHDRIRYRCDGSGWLTERLAP